MIYWYTGQPGHGKTLCAIARALEFKAQGRIVYVCNVRDFDYDKTGCLPMTPEQFRDWPDFLPDGAVCLVDEAYEHGMLPKRPAAQKVPHHVERLATHRHKGLDFIFVCQSPDKQIDGFVHDLIEEHVHVRRRFGTQWQHLRVFDRFERNPEKGTPLTLRRQRLPKHVFGLYKSTELDTTERKIPWYYIAFGLGVPLSLGFMYYVYGGMMDRLVGEAKAAPTAATEGPAASTAQAGIAARPDSERPMSTLDYLTRYVPRVPSQPWSAPVYDDLSVSPDPPRVFCMSAEAGQGESGPRRASCSCVTEQGTIYRMPVPTCRLIARVGQYEPHYTEKSPDYRDAPALREHHEQRIREVDSERVVLDAPGQVAGYGAFRPGGAP